MNEWTTPKPLGVHVSDMVKGWLTLAVVGFCVVTLALLAVKIIAFAWS